MVHPPLLTAITAALLGLFYMYLTMKVVKLRRSERVSLGAGDGQGPLAQAIRMHSNFAEFTPLALIILGSAEMLGLWWPVLLVGLSCLFVGRVLHAYSWVDGKNNFPPRVRGMWLTFAAYAIGSTGVFVAAVTALVAGL